jgi:hypothetical protein
MLPKSVALKKRIKENSERQRSIRHAEKSLKAPLILWQPHPNNIPQCKAFECKADRLFYGGRAGGGKSDLILGLSFTAHQNSIIFRREYPQLKGLIRRAKQIARPVNGRYNNTEKVFAVLPDDREIEFGAVQYEDDVEKYQGRDHDLICFDEITHFSRFMLDYLSGWNRSTIPGQNCRIVCTGNPPTTPEGLWVIEYWSPWLNPDDPLFGQVDYGELVWFVSYTNSENQPVDLVVQVGGDRPDPVEVETTDGIEILDPHSRSFIPASLEDNPYLSGGNYKSVLQALPLELKRALLEGIFTLNFEDDAWQVIPNEWVEAAFKRWEATPPPDTKKSPVSSIGVDVARGGADQTILAIRQGSYFQPIKAYPGTATPDGGAVAAQVVKHYQSGCRINIDVIGVGASVYDILKNTYPNVYALGNEGSSKTDKSKKLAFLNKRAELYWLLREALDPENGANICLPRDNKLKAELCAPRWSLVPPAANNAGKKGRIKVESKDEIKKRIGRSPDRADAICYSWDNSSNGSSGNSAPVIW